MAETVPEGAGVDVREAVDFELAGVGTSKLDWEDKTVGAARVHFNSKEIVANVEVKVIILLVGVGLKV
jgi:hypothetical protein